MSEQTFTQGQTKPYISVICKDGNGNLVNFTEAASVTWTMRLISAPHTVTINAQPAVFVSPRNLGELNYEQTAVEIAAVNEHKGKMRVVWNNGKISYHPTSKNPELNWHFVHVVDDAGAVG